MIPRDYQLSCALEGYKILREHMIVYLAMEERTGKTLTSLIIAEMCQNVTNVQVVTTKSAIGMVNPGPDEEGGWLDTLDKYNHDLNVSILNYHKASKATTKPDLVILDESHNYISAYPKFKGRMLKHSKIWTDVAKLCKGVPIIYISATPHAQGYHQLYPQFALSKWSPWKSYLDYYSWFKDYGIPETVWISGREITTYNKAKSEKSKADVAHLFLTKTRKELDFEYEPTDKIHYIDLDVRTKGLYNELMKDRVIQLPDVDLELIADTPMKMRTALHMLEGGVAKLSNIPEAVANRVPENIASTFNINDRETRSGDLYIVLQNEEKCRFIQEIWGDTDDIIIYYNYIAEKIKLSAYFKNARILQATSNAEGIDLAHYETMIIYSQDFRTAKHTQRRARQASQHRDSKITVHFLLTRDAVSEQVYERVSINKENFVDTVFERIEL